MGSNVSIIGKFFPKIFLRELVFQVIESGVGPIRNRVFEPVPTIPLFQVTFVGLYLLTNN